jgi:hypothetical protein
MRCLFWTRISLYTLLLRNIDVSAGGQPQCLLRRRAHHCQIGPPSGPWLSGKNKPVIYCTSYELSEEACHSPRSPPSTCTYKATCTGHRPTKATAENAIKTLSLLSFGSRFLLKDYLPFPITDIGGEKYLQDYYNTSSAINIRDSFNAIADD